MMKEVPIAGYISFLEKYDENLNEGKPYILEDDKEYIDILENLDVLPKRSPLKRLKDRCFIGFGMSKEVQGC